MASGQGQPDGTGGSRDSASLSGRESILLARNGDRGALGLALDTCRPSLIATANRLLEKELRAKAGGSDLVQETFQEAHRVFDRFDGESIEELLAWLRGILKNKAADLRRRYVLTAKREVRRERSVYDGVTTTVGKNDLEADGRSPSSWAAGREDVARLQAAMAELPEHYRIVLRLRNAELMPFAEIAGQLEVSPEAARKLWTRAIVRLQKVLTKERDRQ